MIHSRCGAPDRPAAASAGPRAPSLRVHPRHDPARAEVEAFIQRVFASRFGATVQHFAPVLVSLRDGDDIVAVAGYRDARTESLFLERYLDAPVDTLLSDGPGSPVPRASVVEVGHLASVRHGEGRRLILLLGAHLAAEGYQWVVGTLTAELRHLFVRIGVTPLALGVADPAALGAEASQWGNYYDHRPVVAAGPVRQALLQLERRLTRLRPPA